MLVTVGKLIRWLGPWERGAPTGPTRDELRIGPRGFRAYLYRPRRRPLAAYLISPGLHFLGPDDPRMDRLGRILAEAGFVVLAPFLPDHVEIRASAGATVDLMAAFDRLEELAARAGLPPPSIFSTSFGSNPSIRLCGDPSYVHRVRGLFLFGGYADFARVCRFAAVGEVEHEGRTLRLPHDPTNAPAVFLNVAAHLGVDAAAADALAEAWRAMCHATWGREVERAEDLRADAARIAEGLPAALRPIFEKGCGLAAGTRELLVEALARAGPSLDFADPREPLARIRAPIVIAHGRDDRTIPYHEAVRLHEMAPPGRSRLFLTGMFTHGSARVPTPWALASEARMLLRMVHSMAALPLGRLDW